MKKFIYIILLFVNIIFGQNPEIKTDLPTIIPPSPTVAALMKFEEVPVSNYTGVPEVYENIFSKKLNFNFNFNLGLSYHPLSVKMDDVASDVGLGWNLVGLGVVTRNINEYPDEHLTPQKKIGIYRSNTSNNLNYNTYLDNALSNVNQPFSNLEQEFLWDTYVNGLYDTKYDTWQFNFCGKTGRFIIKKENNNLIVHFLDNNPHNLKVINYYVDPNSTGQIVKHYEPIGFKIIDESGFEYYFNEIEKTNVDTSNNSTSYYANETNQTLNSLYSFNSAFHLTEIKFNDEIILKVNYGIATSENIINTNTKTYYPINGPISFSNYVNSFVDLFSSSYSKEFLKSLFHPQYETNTTTNSYLSKKVDYIELINIGKINFQYESGRLDDAYGLNNQAKKIKTITIHDLKNSIINKLDFSYQYLQTPKKKLFLNKIELTNNDNESIKSVDFEYNTINSIPYNSLFSDKWGFLTDKNNKDTNKDLVYMFALKKIKRATGGFTEFEFESNTYSNIKGNLIDYESNTNNWTTSNGYTTVDNINTLINTFTITNSKNKVKISNNSINNLTDWTVNIYQNGNSYPVYTNNSCLNGVCENLLIDLPIGDYYVEINSFTMGNPLQTNNVIVNYEISYLKDENIQEKFLYGAGFRIKSIKNFKDSNSKPIYKAFRYNLFNQINTSSGSLNNDVPIYEYLKELKVPKIQNSQYESYGLDLQYRVNSSKNALVSSSMDGEIGYKNVTIDIGEDDIRPIGDRGSIEFVNFNNGKIQLTYSNSIDSPDESISNSPTYYIQGLSNHFKRGLLLNQTYFNYLNKKIKEETFNYQYDQSEIITGVTIYSNYDTGNNINPTCKLFDNFSHFKQARANNHCFSNNVVYNYCGMLNLNQLYNGIGLYRNFIRERIGWSKLISKNSKDYFYTNNNLSGTIETNSNFIYNNLNKKIAQEIITNSIDETLTTKYSYAHDTGNQAMITKNMIGIPLVTQSFRNNLKISEQETQYKDWGNGLLAPEIIKTAKGSNALETRVKYNVIDPSNGNPLEVQQESGIPITYIWGYNKTQPIAKIENATYAEVQQYEANLQTLSNGTNEANLLTALDNLRTALPNAMVTTYTYKPLIGVSTITDPKGYKMTYHYDAFNRLEFVKDQDGNILSENEYHYKN